MQSRHKNREQYFEESAFSCTKHYIPYIKENINIELNSNCNVLEVGCGVGGNLSAFSALDCNVVGVDLNANNIEQCKQLFAKRNLKGSFTSSDIFLFDADGVKFDLLILHDVIEHIEDKEKLLLRLKTFLKDDGTLFIAFPAWQMPFGGHQQVAKSKLLANFPFIHLLPTAVYKGVFKLFGEPDAVINELISIKICRLTIENFFRLRKKTNYKVIDTTLYFINPHYESKFKLKAMKLIPFIAKIKYVRNFFTTSCFSLLQK